MPFRTDIVIGQLKNDNLYPSITPPVFSSDQVITASEITGLKEVKLVITNPNTTGTLIYTTDGSDPRLPGGEKSETATDGEMPMTLSVTISTTVKARIKDGDQWSALRELFIAFPQELNSLKVTEIHYKPLGDGTDGSGGDYEFIELKNTGTVPLNLTGFSISGGITFSFEQGTTVGAGGFIVVASDALKFTQRYGFKPNGEFSGQLSNEGETITLIDNSGNVVKSITYDDKAPWPVEPNKNGNSLVPTDAVKKQDQNDAANWTSSSQVHGSPGSDDSKSIGASVRHKQSSSLSTTVCHIGRFRFALPFSSEYQVSIMNLQGKTVVQFPEKGRSVYNWQPVGKGVFIVVFKDLSGLLLAEKVHIIQ
jgi:hypothetical protein